MTWQPPRAPRGTADVFPDESKRWRRAEEAARAIAERFGYREVRLPIFESTDLYVRGMGENTDVVEKEMFTVGGPQLSDLLGQLGAVIEPMQENVDSLTTRPDAKSALRAGMNSIHFSYNAVAAAERLSLRPEFTAGVVRAYREHGIDKSAAFQKLYAIGPLFRYERPQKGRLRQFHQFNVEALGTVDPLVDVEMIALASAVVGALGIPGFRVRLNSIGDENCRPAYRELLRDRLRPRLSELCETCKVRFDRNVFRVLDCKRCVEKTADLPPMADHLCEPCAAHFATVKGGLDRLGVPFSVDARLVRGFDYYTRTVFEFPCDRLGAQDALGGGGRYDKLIPDMGGPEAGACGFAIGLERLLLAEAAGEPPASPGGLERPRAVYVVGTPEPGVRAEAFALLMELRKAGIEADADFEGRSMKAQMRSANRLGFGFAAILGGDEVQKGEVTVKDMRGEKGAEMRVPRANAVEAIRGKQSAASSV